MRTVPINITGGTYRHKSLPLSAQTTRNYWPQVQQNPATKSKYVLVPFPGKKLFGTSVGARDRGMKEHLGVLYKVTDTTLYSVDSAGVHTALGTIPGSARCIIDGINSNIVIVTEGVPYVWNGSSITTVTDPDLETPNSCAHLNSQILYDGNGGRFASSDVGNAASISGLNYATAESDADDLVRIYVFDQQAYMMGDKTVEPWWNSGLGNPPFDRVEGAIIPIGLGALHSAANSKKYMYFLGNDNQVYRVTGSNFEPVLPEAIVGEISGYNLVSDAVGHCINLNGQWFYIITFITADKTFAYPEGGEAFELSSGTDGGKDIASSYAFAFRKHLVGDYNSGNIYELDVDTYDENGAPMIRQRDTGPLHGELLGAPGKRITMNRFELIMETGVGLLSGQGQDPVVMLSVSDDGGKTFSTERWGQIGRLGQFQLKVEWHNLGSFYSRIIRIRISDPVYCCIHSAAADLEVGI